MNLGVAVTYVAQSNYEKIMNNKCDLGKTDSDVVLRSLTAPCRERVEVEKALVNYRLEPDSGLVIEDVL